MVIQHAQPLVSVVVPVYNGARFILECMTSIVEQSYSNLEILVVDDGSIDGSVEIIESFIQEHHQKNIRLFRQANAGSAAARNKGFIHSKGMYVAFLDADDSWFPNKIEEQISEITQTGIRVVGSLMRYANSKSRMFGICGEDASNRQSDIKLGKYMPTVLSSFVFNSELIESISGFDEQLRFSQDLDLLARCAQQTEVKVLKKPLGIYRLHGRSISTVNGLEQERSYEYIKFKFSDYPNKSEDLTYIDFLQLHRFKISPDRKAAIHFRNFGVQIMNGNILLGASHLLRAVSISPIYVARRIFLRFGGWFIWKSGKKRRS
jgi:glycosyltransferase involved in cell wall biosynthesis